ncbi:penicillin amidase family protein [Streptomyces sp. NL15-2K]|nr:penicillin amidase family protein [Streptomyces sp. NL15-2K]
MTALDRAWQLEVERHRAQGTSAAFLGTDALAWDGFARRARLDDTARRCFSSLERRDPETADWVRAYVDGVNDGLDRATAPEFARVGLAPGRWEPWTPLGVWLATHILFAGFPAKLWREQVVQHLGADAVALFATDGPGTSGSNGWLVSGERTTTGHAVIAGDPHRFIEDPGVYQQIHLSCPEFDVVGLAVPGVPGIAHFGHTGTVAWAITNAMADYQDLYRERLRRTGAGVEALGPDGVWRRAARHTETVEVAGEEPVEVEVIETDRGPVIIGGPEGLDDRVPDSGTPVADRACVTSPVGRATPGTHARRVAEPPTWLLPHARTTSRGGTPIEGAPAPCDRTHQTPRADPTGDVTQALSLRYPPRVTEDLGFSALLPLLRARRVADVDRALDLWAEPVNVVQAADTEGGLLHRVAGRVPLRAEANRIRLVPAWEPGHGWEGRHETPYAGLTDGIAVMANQRGPATSLGVEFAPPHRADRITALLTERDRWSAADMPVIHMDTRLASAVPLLDQLEALDGLTPEAAAIRDALLRWDRHMDANSTDAAVYAAVRGAVVRRLAAHPAFAALTTPPAYPEVFLPWLNLVPRVGFALEHLLRADELYGIDRAETVRAAVEEVAASGDLPATWGDTHRLSPWRALVPRQATFAPSRRPARSPTALKAWEVPPLAAPGTDPSTSSTRACARHAESTHRTPLLDGQTLPAAALADPPSEGPGLSGDHDCVLCTSAVPGWTDLSARGPAARYVWDLARREDSLWVVPFGASGVPGSPHHRDQLPLWLRGDLVPVVTDWQQLKKENEDA